MGLSKYEVVNELIERMESASTDGIETIRDLCLSPDIQCDFPNYSEGTGRFVFLLPEEKIVIKVAISQGGIEQNMTESDNSGTPWLTEVLEEHEVLGIDYLMLVNPYCSPLDDTIEAVKETLVKTLGELTLFSDSKSTIENLLSESIKGTSTHLTLSYFLSLVDFPVYDGVCLRDLIDYVFDELEFEEFIVDYLSDEVDWMDRNIDNFGTNEMGMLTVVDAGLNNADETMAYLKRRKEYLSIGDVYEVG